MSLLFFLFHSQGYCLSPTDGAITNDANDFARPNILHVFVFAIFGRVNKGGSRV